MNIPGIPFPLEPSPGSTWRIDGGDKTLRVSAAPRSDIFVDPAGEDLANAATLMNAVTMLGRAPAGDFQLSARVEVDFRATFDAGVLLLWFDESLWAKFCFEFSPAGDAMVVSVVNRGVADDANSFTVETSHIWLRVARVGRVFAFHASRDGANWELVRAFVLGPAEHSLRIGFEAQSPNGDGCDVEFSEIVFGSETLKSLRDGS